MNSTTFCHRSDEDATTATVNHFDIDTKWIRAFLDADGAFKSHRKGRCCYALENGVWRHGQRRICSVTRATGAVESGWTEQPLHSNRHQKRIRWLTRRWRRCRCLVFFDIEIQQWRRFRLGQRRRHFDLKLQLKKKHFFLQLSFKLNWKMPRGKKRQNDFNNLIKKANRKTDSLHCPLATDRSACPVCWNVHALNNRPSDKSLLFSVQRQLLPL